LATLADVTDDVAARVPTRTLNDGLEVPSIGFGTWPLRGEAGIDAMRNAIGSGYRLIDAAFNYDNEGAVGEAVRRSGVPRDELIVTSKLPGRFHRYQAAIAAIEESVLRTGLDHIDLYLVHWPNPEQQVYVEAWRALIAARDRGLLRSIGVSNFLPEHLTRIVEETGVSPSVNQIELHPYFSQVEQRAYDQEHGIVDESWSPLARAVEIVDEPSLTAIAAEHHKTVSQVVLRWHVQLGALPLPKSVDPVRQKENLDVFDFTLSDEQMAAINSLSRPDGRLKDQDPAVYEEF
jgi:diketogulonate reductase-like aldo/keto reductase